MEHRDLETELLLGDIIRDGGDVSYYLNDTDSLEGEGEAGSGDRTIEEEGHDHDGSGDRMPVEEGTVMTAPVTKQSPTRYIY